MSAVRPAPLSEAAWRPAARRAGQAEAARDRTLRRLSTGRRIVTGADGPADLIAAEALRAHGTRIDQAVRSADRAEAVTNVLEATLAGVQDHLTELGRLVGEAANALGPAELAATQRQADDLITDVDRLIRSATFNGRPLLNAPPAQPAAIPLLHERPGVERRGHPQTGQRGKPHAYALTEGGRTHALSGNRWERLVLPGRYAVTPDTVLTFEFSSTIEGEIHGVAFDEAGRGLPETRRTAQIHGHQNWGDRRHHYAGGRQSFAIRPADFGVASFDTVLLIDDDDSFRNGGGNSNFRDLRLYETTPQVTGDPEVSLRFNLTPDVARGAAGLDTLTLPELSATTLGTGLVSLRSLRTGGGHELTGGRLAEAAGAVEAARQTVARRRGEVGAFRRHAVRATAAAQGQAGVRNAAALARVEDADVAREAAELARLDLLRAARPGLAAARRQAAARVLDLLG